MRTLWVCAFVVASMSPLARASIHNVSRISDYSLSFDDPSFSNTVLHLNIRQDRTADAPGDSRFEQWGILPNSFNVSWEAFEGVTLSDVTFVNNVLAGTIASPAGSPGYTILRNDAPPNGTSIAVGVLGDRHTLAINLQVGGGVDFGSPASFRMVIPGDWSQSGTGFHQHELISYNPAWTLLRDFEYDTLLDATIFELGTTAYQVPPAPQFRLHGATVPSPAGVSFLALGFVAASRTRRAPARSGLRL
ncbi:MAG: hypothetical protein GIKADHBN_00244 [Phycisphaerales bacterium]|nr:hypothetical protein [Phycisphaerales bacterium]